MRNLGASLEKRVGVNVDEILQVVDRYDLEPNIRNFDQFGFILTDASKRTVRIAVGKYRDDVIHLPRLNADVGVVFVDQMCLGWVESTTLMDAGDILIAKTKMIQPMPDTFDFNKTCPHLETYGGFLEGDYWECAGCNTLIKAHVDES